MKTVEIYDPAMCCSSGVCGPTPDQALAAFAGAVEKLKAAGVSIVRHNLSQNPLAFAQQVDVKAVLQSQGEAGLPLVLVDGKIAFRGAYPTLSQLSDAIGLNPPSESCCSAEPAKPRPAFVKVEPPKAVGDARCCDPASGCC